MTLISTVRDAKKPLQLLSCAVVFRKFIPEGLSSYDPTGRVALVRCPYGVSV